MLDANTILEGRLYHDLAWLWPIISPPDEYAEEAAHWRRVLEETVAHGSAILELGVGGGHNLSQFADEYVATAVDLSPAMLAHSRRLNPHVEHHVSDMRNVRLGRAFSAVLIHDAVSCMRAENDLRSTFATAREHLTSGGVFIISPDDYQETFSGPTLHSSMHVSGDTHVTMIEYAHDPNPHDSTVESIITYIIRDATGVRIEHDRLVTGLFGKSTWIRLMTEAGFRVTERLFQLGAATTEYRLLVGYA